MNGLLDAFDKIIVWYNDYIGGYAILVLLVPTGLYFTFRLKFLNVTRLWHSIRVVAGKYDNKEDAGDVNHFKALTTALSATVGTGNIVGVALAIYLGGPGAVFWMWVTGFLGMTLKYAECTLAHKYRVFNSDGTVSYIRDAIGKIYHMPKAAKILAGIFAVATILASLGTGNMAQANGMTDALRTTFGFPTWASGIVITGLVLLIIVGGLQRIADVTSKLVPFMAVTYVLAIMVVLIDRAAYLPHAFGELLPGRRPQEGLWVPPL